MATITADGDMQIRKASKRGKKQLLVSGTFGAGTITLMIAYKNSEDYVSSLTTITADGLYTLDVPATYSVKPVLAGATAPNIVYRWL